MAKEFARKVRYVTNIYVVDDPRDVDADDDDADDDHDDGDQKGGCRHSQEEGADPNIAGAGLRAGLRIGQKGVF